MRKELWTGAGLDDVWGAIADVGALHTRLVPGFVVASSLDGNVRRVTFANGASVIEPIVTIDAEARRLVWTSSGGVTTHYNASLQAFPDGGGTRVVWIADFLPDEAADRIEAAMTAGMKAMQRTLDGLSAD